MGDYLLERYELSGHDKVSLPGVMQVLRSAVPLEDVEGIPFFEEVLEDLKDLPPPKKFSLFYKPRAVLDAVANTYIQAAKEYYQNWCKQSGAEFFDAWEEDAIPARPAHVLALDGVFPWAPHMFYVNRASLTGSGTSSYEVVNAPSNDQTSKISFTLSDSATPLKGEVLNGTVPMKVTPFEDFSEWLLATAGPFELTSTTQFVENSGTSRKSDMSTSSAITWSNLIYASAVVEARVAPEYEGVLSALDFDESSLFIGTSSVAQKSAVGGIVRCGEESPCLGFPAVVLRQLFVDRSLVTSVLASEPDPDSFGSGKMLDIRQTGERLRRMGTGLQLQSSPVDTSFVPVDRDGNITAQFVTSFLATDRLRDVTSSRYQYTRENAGTSSSDRLVRLDRTNGLIQGEMPSVQVGLPGFKPVFWRDINVVLMAGTPPNVDDWVAPVRLYLLELMPEARFVRPEKLDVGEDFGEATTVTELEDLLRGIDQATLKDRCLDPNTYAESAIRVDLFPVISFRTYRIEGSVYCLAAVSRRGFVNPLNGAVAAGTDVLYYAPFSRANAWYETAQRAQCSDNVDDLYKNTLWTSTTDTYFIKNGLSSIWISSYGESVLNRAVVKPYTTIGAYPQYPGLDETQEIDFSVIGATYPAFGAHPTVSRYMDGLLERYIRLWVPCTITRGVGISYDGQVFTGNLQFDVTYNRTATFDYTSSTSGSVGATGDFVLGNSETRMHACKGRFDVSWDTSSVGTLERFYDSNGGIVSLPGLLRLPELPEKLYGGGIPPWGDATLEEMHAHDGDGGSLYSHETDSISIISKALAIERFMPNTARISGVGGNGTIRHIGEQLYTAVSPYAKPSSGPQSDYKVVSFPLWDAVSAYATGLYALPDGYSWTHEGRAVEASDLVGMLGYTSVSNIKAVSTDLNKYVFGKEVSGGRVCWSLMGATASFGAYPYPTRGRAYVFAGSDGATVGLSANGALSQPYPAPFNLHIVDVCPQPSHSYGLQSYVWDATPYYFPQGSVFDVCTVYRPLLTVPGSHAGSFRHRTLFEDSETPPVDGHLSVSDTALGMWDARSSSQSENMECNGGNLLYPTNVDALMEGTCVFFPYRPMLMPYELDMEGPGTYIVEDPATRINPSRNGV